MKTTQRSYRHSPMDIILTQNLANQNHDWFDGDVIPRDLVDVLAEEEIDENDSADEIHTYMDDDEEEEEEYD